MEFQIFQRILVNIVKIRPPIFLDEFYLLVIKAFLFNVFTYKGPKVYNRILFKIRHTVRDFMAQIEERERNESLKSAQNQPAEHNENIKPMNK